GDRRRPVAELGLDPLGGDEETTGGDHAAPRERARPPDDDRVLPRPGPERVERLRGRDAEPATLAGREPPVAVMLAEDDAALVHERAALAAQSPAREERPVVVTGQETRLLALRPVRGGQTCPLGFRASLVLRLLAERKPDPLEQPRVEPGEHVGLILGPSCAAA